MSVTEHESEIYFKLMADATEVLIWKLNAEGKSVFYNRSMRTFLGNPRNLDIMDWSVIIHPDDVNNTLTKIRSAIANSQPFMLECRLLRADSEYRWIDSKGNPVLDVNNNLLGYIGTSTDVTESKAKSELIREGEFKLDLAIEAGELCVWDYNPLTHKFNVNKRMKEWCGIEDDTDLGGELGFAAVSSADKEKVRNAIKKALTWGDGNYNVQYTIINVKTGRERIVCAKGRATFGEDKIAYRLDGILQDITEQALAQKKLEESEQRFQNLIRDASTAIVVHSKEDMKVEIVNDAYARLINLKTADLLGKPIFSVIPEAEEYYRPQLERVLETGETLQIFDSPYSVTTNGKLSEGFVNVTYQPLRNDQKEILGVMAIAQEVTESVMARKKLEQSEKKFEAAIAAVEGIIWTNNAIGEMEGEQPGWTALTGQTYEEYRGYGWANKVHHDDAVPTTEAWNDAVRQKKIFEFEHRLKTKDKSWRMFSIKAVPSFDKDGNIEQWVGVHTDITEQKEAFEKIQESEERFRSLTQTLPQLIWMTDAKGKLEFASDKWKAYTGFEPGAENEWKHIVHPDDYNLITTGWQKFIKVGVKYNFDVRLKNKSGDYRWHTVMGEPIFDIEKNILKWVGAFTDTHSDKLFKEELESQVKNRTQELRESNRELERKNAELQSFTYVASHDLQEPLRKIQTFATALLDNEKDKISDISKGYLNRTLQAAFRMRSLIKDLLNFSRLNFIEGQFELIDVRDVIKVFKEEFEEIITEKNAVIEVGEEMAKINVIPYQFQQLMHNLLGNALKFTTKDIPPHLIINSTKAQGNALNNNILLPLVTYNHISVADNGIGIKPEYLDRIFEVFKRLHHNHEYAGTGIGLSIVKKVVENHKGIITVESLYGNGTVFNIYIPA